ncbi:MAG: hypothetical protein ACREHG_05495, partial [Candidatus Saccharimonadales bacterium]
LVSITGRTPEEWRNKLQEIQERGIWETALFLEFYSPEEKQKIYESLKDSCVKSIPLVHLRHDMAADEIKFLKKTFSVKYFTCHEENFVNGDVAHWKEFFPDIYLEMNVDGIVSPRVDVDAIGGFCIDLAHFKIDLENLNKDFEYVFTRKEKPIFLCNHLNGWNPETNMDMHTIHSLKNFDYLKTLPKFVFGNTIALEMFNSIAEQLEYKNYLEDLFRQKFVEKQ